MTDYGLNAEETLIAGTGGLFFADKGAEFPASIDDPIDLDVWQSTGLTAEDGVSLMLDQTFKDFGSWQTTGPVRRKRKGTIQSFTANLLQINRPNLLLCAGGQVVGSTGDWTYHPPGEDDNVAEYAFLLEVADGDRLDRIGFYRGVASAKVTAKFNDDEMTNLPLEVTALSPDGFEDPDYPGRPWFWQSNSEAFDEPAPTSP